jgi:hypothetical protein
MRHSLLLCVLYASLSPLTAWAVEDVNKILKTIEANGAPPNERVNLKMIIQEADGGKKIRELTILRKSGSASDGARALVRLQKPSDLKGLSLLTVVKSGKEEQYLYLPSDKKSRRILGSSKRGQFLDSEIAYEDLAISTYREFNNKVLKEKNGMVELESRAKEKSDSSYGKILTWISKPDYKIDHVEYYDHAGKLLKRAQFKGYQLVGANLWRAKEIQVQNVQTNRKTALLMQKVSLKNIQTDEVSLSALED